MSSMTLFILFVCIIALLFLFINLVFAPHNPKNWLWKSIITREKLSNPGEALKLLIPSNYWKIICGWTNYSCMVTSLEASDRNVGNRGSKSVILNNIAVKEQRVYGSCIGTLLNSPMLRCTLQGFEKNYQIRIPSNHLSSLRLYSTVTSIVANSQTGSYTLKPYFVTGFTDGVLRVVVL